MWDSPGVSALAAHGPQSLCRGLVWDAAPGQPSRGRSHRGVPPRGECARLAHEMPPKDITLTQDETFTGGLCLVGIEPVSNYIVLEQAAQARDQDTWHALMEQALAGLNCRVMQSTSDEAPGLLAYVEHHLGAHHSPDLFHVQHELSKAVSAPMAVKQRAAAQGRHAGGRDAQAGARAPQQRQRRACTAWPRPSPKGGREPGAGHTGGGRSSPRAPTPRRAARDRSAQSIRAIGHAYHFVDLERGVRRNGKLIAGDIQQPHRHDPHHCPAGTPQRDLPGASRESRARGAQNAGHHRVRLGVCGPAGQTTGVGTAAVLRHACASHSVVLPRPCGLNSDGHRR